MSPQPGETLSQIGLAIRFQRSAKWIRAQCELVTGITREAEQETWARMEYGNGRCAGYKFVSGNDT
jgi:hypothetical protein